MSLSRVSDYYWRTLDYFYMHPRFKSYYLDMVPRAKEILCHITWTWFPEPRKYYFPGQINHYPGQITLDLKVRNQDKCEKAYYINAQSIIDIFYGTASSSALLAV